MRTLRFHHDLYSARAIEEACESFENHAKITVRQELPYFELELTALGSADEAVLAGEFGNFALALTAEEKRGGAAKD